MEINRITILSYFTLFLFILLINIYAEDETGGVQIPYIESGIGGIPCGMGGAFTAIADDGNAPFYNPAGLPLINKKIFTLNYQNSFIGNANFIYLSYVGILKENQQGLGVSFIWNGVGNLPSYTSEQMSSGIYSFSQIQVGVSYGISLSPNFYAGITGKFFYYNIAIYSANNFDSDIGIFYHFIKNLKIGVLFQNFLPFEHKLYSQKENIPFTIRTGVSYNLSKYKLLLIYEIGKQIQTSFSTIHFSHHFGIKYNFLKVINLVAGYNDGDITFGLQLSLEKFSFFTGTAQNRLGGRLNFSASYKFEEKPSAEIEMEYFYEGVVAYQNKDYRTAIKYFKKVLEYRNNPVAQYYLNNARAYLESEKWMSEEDKALIEMKLELAKKYISHGLYSKAITTLREILDFNPENEEAQSLMTKVKATVQKDVERYYNKALSLFKSNKYKESLNECENALNLNPEHKPSLELKEKNEALLKDILSAQKREEEKKAEAEALYQQGLLNYQEENWVEAINNFKKSYDLVPNEEVKNYLEKAKKKLNEVRLTKKRKKESETHFKIGLSFYNKGKLKDAISEFEKAVNLYPQNTKAEEYLNKAKAKYEAIINKPLESGKIALREGRLYDAIKSFEQALKIDPKNAIAKQFLKKAKSLIKDYITLNLKSAKEEYKKENYAKALKYYREVLRLAPNNKEAKTGVQKSRSKIEEKIKAHFNKGIKFFNKNKLKQAIAEFEKALSLDPEYTPAKDFLTKAQKKYEANKIIFTRQEYMQNGIDFFQNKDFEKAKKYFQKVLEIDPDNNEAREYIERCDEELENLKKQEKIAKIITDGMIFYRKRKYTDAIKIWKKVKEIDPENRIIDEYIEYARRAQEESMNKFYNNGVKYFEQGDLLKAKENLEKALQANPHLKKAKKKLAEVKSAIFQKIYEAKKKGKTEFKKGNYKKAIKYFEEVLTYEKENDEIEDYLKLSEEARSALKEGKKLLKAKKYAEAMEKFNLVLELNKNDKKASNYIKQLLIEGKKQASKWFNQGLNYYKKGDLKRAYIRFLSVVEIEPNHQEARKMLNKVKAEIDKKCASLYKSAISYYERGSYKNAIREFEKILRLKNNYRDTRLLLTKARKRYIAITAKERQVIEEKIQQYLYAGIKLYRNGKLNEAIQEWKKVLKIDPDNSKATKYINRAKYKLKQLEKLK